MPWGKGEKHWMTKLTDADVRTIRKELLRPTAVELAKRYGVTTTTIHNIRSGKTWKHIAAEGDDGN